MLRFVIWLILVGCAHGTAVCPQVEQPMPRCLACEPCLVLPPPPPPVLVGDRDSDRARLSDAYYALERYVRLYALPSCGPHPTR